MLTMLLAAVLTSTSAGLPSPGVDLAWTLRTEMRSEDLRISSAVDRFLALPTLERDACLVEWAKITKPEGPALVLFGELRAARDRPTPRAPLGGSKTSDTRNAGAPEVRQTRDTRDLLDAPHGRPRTVPALDFATLERLRKGSRTHAIGGGFVASGILTMIGSAIGGIVSVANDGEIWPAGVGVGVGGLVMGIGFAVMSAGDEDFRPGAAEDE